MKASISSVSKDNSRSDKKQVYAQKKPGQNGFSKSNSWTPKRSKKSDDPDVIYGYDFSGNVTDIASLETDMGEVLLHGEVFTPEAVKTKSGRYAFKFNLYDGTDSISCSAFIPLRASVSEKME